MWRQAGFAVTALMLILSSALPGQRAAAAPAAAGWAEERIEQMSSVYEIAPDGVVRVTETIKLFSPHGRGLTRTFELRAQDTDDWSKDRVVRVDQLTVESPTGAGTTISRRKYDPGLAGDDNDVDTRYELLDITLPEIARNGRETYILRYELRGALRRVEGGLELSVTGPFQAIAAGALTATVRAPAAIGSATCRWYNEPCTSATVRNSVAQFNDHAPGHEYHTGSLNTLDYTIGVPADAVPGAGLILESPPLPKLPIAGGVLLLVALLIFVRKRRRRRHPSAGSIHA
ncbi:DUF2207 domain-containing protein [Kribbella sp. NPDC054772]